MKHFENRIGFEHCSRFVLANGQWAEKISQFKFNANYCVEYWIDFTELHRKLKGTIINIYN